MRLASPPEEPPGVRSVLCGFFVKPHTGLLQPKLSMVCGMFVKQNGTAPRLRMAASREASSSLGWPMKIDRPVVGS